MTTWQSPTRHWFQQILAAAEWKPWSWREIFLANDIRNSSLLELWPWPTGIFMFSFMGPYSSYEWTYIPCPWPGYSPYKWSYILWLGRGRCCRAKTRTHPEVNLGDVGWYIPGFMCRSEGFDGHSLCKKRFGEFQSPKGNLCLQKMSPKRFYGGL